MNSSDSRRRSNNHFPADGQGATAEKKKGDRGQISAFCLFFIPVRGSRDRYLRNRNIQNRDLRERPRDSSPGERYISVLPTDKKDSFPGPQRLKKFCGSAFVKCAYGL